MKQVITTLLKSNTPTIIYGKSGWGKTQIIEQSAEALGMKCYVLCLAGVAPEDFGIPTVKDSYYEYLPPKWAAEFHKTGENFVLFLDEITQATIQVMHAIYPLVLERKIGGLQLPNMRVIAASNYEKENPHLTEIMKPLLNRFCAEIKIEEDFGQSMIDDFWKYISDKYPRQKEAISKLRLNNVIATNPRAYEDGLVFLDKNPTADEHTKKIIFRKSFGDLACLLEGVKQEFINNETDVDIRLKKASFAHRNKILEFYGTIKSMPTKDEIIETFKLTPEEQEIVFI